MSEIEVAGSADASTWFDLGCALQRAERHREALAAYTQAQAIDPNFPTLRNRDRRGAFGSRKHLRPKRTPSERLADSRLRFPLSREKLLSDSP